MLKIIEGNLFDSSARIIAHQVNCQGVMGSGVAKQIKDKYPGVFKEYTTLCHDVESSEDLLGKSHLIHSDGSQIELGEDYEGTYVANLFGQDKYGYDGKQYTDVEALGKAFVDLYRQATTLGVDTIAMPYKIGCCRGGADWSRVYMILESIFKKIDVELWKLGGDKIV